MADERYPIETLDEDDDDGTMPANVAELAEAVIGGADTEDRMVHGLRVQQEGFEVGVGAAVARVGESDSLAVIEGDDERLSGAVPLALHLLLGGGHDPSPDGYTTWHIYADFGDVMELTVGWSCGNPFYYGYGFDIMVEQLPPR